jgi:hypothetical protein
MNDISATGARPETAFLTWDDEHGVGFLPVTAFVYDDAYFAKYRGYQETALGVALEGARCNLVERFKVREVLDVGVGALSFLRTLIGRRVVSTFGGFDVNPAAVAKLRASGLWADPRDEVFEALTFWDSLEHIDDPRPYLAGARSFVFVSTPIYRDRGHVLASKHFRPDEHCWYFTAAGLRWFMRELGFECLEESRIESDLGREDIGTFVFKRIRNGGNCEA